jgi:acetyl esterase
MPLHPLISQLVELLAATGAPPPWESTLEEVRAGHLQRRAWGGPLVELVEILDRTIAGSLNVRIYHPSTQRPAPVLIWYHGGGWVVGSIEAQEPICRLLAVRSQCAVVAVDYRLAPEHPFPAALDDASAVLAWVRAEGHLHGLDATRIAVGGDSAGANLAAVVALRAGDSGLPALRFQALVYPVTDATMAHPSYTELATGYVLTAQGMRWYFDQYAPGVDPRHPELSPLHARSLRGLPPALVLTAEFDPLRDEGEAYARRLQTEGVPVTLHRCPGVVHGFFAMAGFVDTADEAVTEVAAAVREALA